MKSLGVSELKPDAAVELVVGVVAALAAELTLAVDMVFSPV
jgi:hypothetical protein